MSAFEKLLNGILWLCMFGMIALLLLLAYAVVTGQVHMPTPTPSNSQLQATIQALETLVPR